MAPSNNDLFDLTAAAEADLVGLLEDAGLAPPAAAGLGAAVAVVAQDMARGAILGMLVRMRRTKSGTALLLAVVPGAESVRTAAARLRVSPAALQAEIEKTRAALADPNG